MLGEACQDRSRFSFASLRANLLSIAPDQAHFSTRGFSAPTTAIQQHLERAGESFLHGYNQALRDESIDALHARLADLEASLRGFAYEGAAMALSLLDRFSFRRNRITQLLDGPGQAHIYMIHVGIGWMMARIPWGRRRVMARLDPLLRWLAIDGFGFHEGYFNPVKYTRGAKARGRGYWRNAFDQGLGRSFWFVMGTSVPRIASAIESLDDSRRGDLWSGVGLAATYAGGADETALLELKDAAGNLASHVAQGVAFAAKARQRAGFITSNARLACEILCDAPLSKVVETVDDAMNNLPIDAEVPAYEIWRQRIRASFNPSRHAVLVGDAR